jgi:hypothetical protein
MPHPKQEHCHCWIQGVFGFSTPFGIEHDGVWHSIVTWFIGVLHDTIAQEHNEMAHSNQQYLVEQFEVILCAIILPVVPVA